MKPQLLEPMMAVEINTPEEYLGNILGGLNRRRSVILSQEMTGLQNRIEAEVPLAEMFGYVNHLRSVSAGRANYSMKFKHYASLPEQKVEEVLAQV